MQKQGLFFLMSIFLLLAALVLSACQTNNASNLPTIATGSMSGNQSAGVDSATFVDWPTAVQWIMDGKVIQVAQTHDLQVILDLKSGDQWQTVEPSIDDVFKVINECGKPCENMILMTE
jgi:hypothetical protein